MIAEKLWKGYFGFWFFGKKELRIRGGKIGLNIDCD